MSCTPLTDSERARIQFVINYFAQNYEKPIDQLAADALKGLHDRFGYSSEIKLLEALRDSPHTALLKLALNVSCSGGESSVPVGMLNSAIYESSRDKIFATSAGQIYRLNSTTGAREDVSDFSYPTLSLDSYVTYVGGSIDRLFASASDATGSNSYLYIINPDTLKVESAKNVTALNPNAPFPIRQLITIGGKVFGVGIVSPLANFILFGFDPNTNTFSPSVSIPGFVDRLVLSSDPDSGGIWSWSQDGPAVNFRVSDFGSLGSLSYGTSMYAQAMLYHSHYLYVSPLTLSGVRSQDLWRRKTDGSGGATLDLGRPNAVPFNIRYRQSNDRLYIPTWTDNAVVIVNPSSFTVESVKTGFDSPFDVVFTTTKAFAVQHGGVGIKEII